MKIDDEYIVNFFFTNKGNINPNKTKKYYRNTLDINIVNYLNNRYDDSESITETLIRIKNNINVKPECPICHKKLKYSGNCKIPYYTYCSDVCANKDNEKKKKSYNTMIINYGENNKYNKNKAIQTYNNKSEKEKTIIKIKRSNTLKNKSIEEKQIIREKCHKTWLKIMDIKK